jgi:maltose alpha-D-glucosyltransferase/alpha-amylase
MHVGAAFLNAYLAGINVALIPAEPQHTRIILDCYLIEKAIYEIGYELNNRPDWAIVPLRGLLNLLESE